MAVLVFKGVPVEFHKETIDGLRVKEYTVGDLYLQTRADGSAHQYISVNGVHMPIEWARDLNRGKVTLAEIEAHIARS